MPPSTIGDIAVWKFGCTGVPGFCHSSLPEAASNAVTRPVMPSVNNRPSAKAGVDFGPGPCRLVLLFIWNAAA